MHSCQPILKSENWFIHGLKMSSNFQEIWSNPPPPLFKIMQYCHISASVSPPPLKSPHNFFFFLCLRYKVAGGIMFSGCLSVRKSDSRDRVISRTNWWITPKLGSCMYLAEPMNWLDFGYTRSKVKGHRAQYVCKNSTWSHYLKNQSMDSLPNLGHVHVCILQS